MRHDMGKCVIEAPRRGSRTAESAKVRHYGKFVEDGEGIDYEGFSRLPVSRKQEGYNKRLGDKSFSDKLGPLNRYLRSSCGRPWDDVYSEIARVFGRSGSEGIRHIKDAHINVATNTYRAVNGKVYERGKHGVHEVGEYYREYAFYVEPETCILREAAPFKLPKKAKPPVERIAIGDWTAYQKIDGIWYFTEYMTTEKLEPVYLREFVKGEGFKQAEKPYTYRTVTKDVVVVKRQLGKKELKGLRKLLDKGPNV